MPSDRPSHTCTSFMRSSLIVKSADLPASVREGSPLDSALNSALHRAKLQPDQHLVSGRSFHVAWLLLVL